LVRLRFLYLDYRFLFPLQEDDDDVTAPEGVHKLVLQAKAAFGSENVEAAEDFLVVSVPLRKSL